ncbi:MAG TPA: penicillin-binding transpeptidase domain-containing protein, partial [Mycobacteriales bacterium]|nr:penicillin-binding transpeptidase domain-containing protein [Mycobacteriales bacterium]
VDDVTGQPLVRNRTALVVSVNRGLLRAQDDGGDDVLARLGGLVGRSAQDLRQAITPCGGGVRPPCWRGSPYQPVPVAEFDAADADGVARVLTVEERREDFPGVSVDFRAVREHPGGESAAHVLGYLGPISSEEVGTAPYDGVRPDALVGRAGVEASYDADLRGRDGVEQLEVDHLGAVTGRRTTTEPEPGATLVLSLHAGVQRAAEQALERAVARPRATPARGGGGQRLRADSGAVVVMEARTGRVVALASHPTYDPTVFVGGASPAQYAALVDEARGAPLVSRTVQGAYAPASTFKVVTTAAAVQSGDYPLTGRYPCPGSYAPLGGKRNFEGVGMGDIDLRTALVRSCDTVYYAFAYEQWLRDGGNRPVQSPRDPVLAMATAFGLGERTGVDLPGERRGTVPDRAWLRARWEERRADHCAGADNPAFDAERRRANREYCEDGWRFRGGDAANVAVGQGDLLVTPLQLATVYAAVANGGTLLSPRVGRALVTPDGVREIAPQVRGRVPVDQAVLAYVRDALAAVTTEGTAAGAFAGLPLHVAGKTGTGEVAGKQDTSWFASYAPADDPQLVVVGVVSQGGTGGTVAAPMVREVYEAVFGLRGAPPLLPGGRLPAAVPEVER